MIPARMRIYNRYSAKSDGYGSPSLDQINPTGTIKIAWYITDVDTQANIVFGSAAFMGLTKDTTVKIGDYIGGRKSGLTEKILQVTYVLSVGRYVQVYAKETSYIEVAA